MIAGLSIWAKSIVLAVIIVSILEMLLPNNKTKKYVKTIMGIFILYNIISPLIKNESSLSFEEVDLQEYSSNIVNSIEVNQESMDKRLQDLYIQELEKDITKKVEKKGYIVKSCKVNAKISDDENETGISKISLKIEKNMNFENNEEKNNETDELENKLVTEVQKIKKIDTKISSSDNSSENTGIEKADIQNLKKFLIEEYEVNERCLEIK